MTTTNKTLITVASTIQAPAEMVWECWTGPSHITQWNHASAEWHTPRAENDVRVGGHFLYRMEAKDGSFGFDFEGTYYLVEPYRLLAYTIADGRKVTITFEAQTGTTFVSETFEADTEHSSEMQQAGWQAILDNFKKYVESIIL